jgi:hypothetical protein
MKYYLVTITLVALAVNAIAQERSKEDVTYYKHWIGCKAPPFNCDQSDRTNYMETSYKGKKVFLYSFDAGNFVDSPNLPQLTKELRRLHQARTNSENAFVVIGFTRGLLWSPCFGETNLPTEIDELSRFPIVNLNNKRGEGALGEPYELLKEPGGILIGTNGIICAIFPYKMTERDFKSISGIPSWKGEPHEPPKK